MSKKKPAQRAFRLESLECRAMLSVTAYSNNFDGAEVRAPGIVGSISGFANYESVAGLGEYGFDGNLLRNMSASGSRSTLQLTGLPEHESIDLNFLLAIIDSWDGTGATLGPDQFNVVVDGQTIFSEVFSNAQGTQSYSAPVGGELARKQELGWRNKNGDDNESAYDMSVEPRLQAIPHTSDTLTVQFFAAGPGWQGAADESFALENLEVVLNGIEEAEPTPELAYSNDFDGNESRTPGVTGSIDGFASYEGVAGLDGYGFDGNLLRNMSTSGSRTTLRLTGLPDHESVDLDFLLAIIDSWDGTGASLGPDRFSVTVDGQTVFSEVFSNAQGAQSYVAPAGGELVRRVELGWRNKNGDDNESAYDMGLEPRLQGIPHTADSLSVQFFASGSGWQGATDESFAIDNLKVILNATDGHRPGHGLISPIFGFPFPDAPTPEPESPTPDPEPPTPETPISNPEVVRFPADAGVINVKSAPYNAKGDGVTDDTAAILAALRDWNAHTTEHSSRVVYLPAGTYLVSDTIQARDTLGRLQSNVRIHGEGEQLTTIKLKNNATGFTNASSPKPVVATHGEDGNRGNWAFGNYIEHLTVDVGSGNAGAIGIAYQVANWGSVTHVTIKAGTNSGRFGMYIDDLAGSGMVKNVTIDGFAYGIQAITAVNNIVFEHLELNNQRSAAIWNVSKNLVIRGLKSNNTVPAVTQSTSEAYMLLIDSELTGGASNATAIENTKGGYLFLRNVTVDGYGKAVDGTSRDVSGGSDRYIAEYLSHGGVDKLWDSASSQSFNLPVKEAPEYHTNDFAKWANVMDFGATRNDSKDDTAAVQRAIDSGAEIIYFPFGEYNIGGKIIVRGNVKKIDFMSSEVEGKSEIEIGAVNGDFVILENLDTALSSTSMKRVVHNSAAALVLRHIGESTMSLTNTAQAKELFIEDMGPHIRVNLSNGIKAWIRQLNREWVPFKNVGSTAWILGMNMEGKHGRRVPEFLTSEGGLTEVLGGAIDPRIGYFNRDPLFTVRDAAISVAIAGYSRPIDEGMGTYTTVVEETRNGITRKLTDTVAFERAKLRIVIPLFIAGNYSY